MGNDHRPHALRDHDLNAATATLGALPRAITSTAPAVAPAGGTSVATAGAAPGSEPAISRERLLALANRSDPAAFLVAAAPWLARHPEESELRLRAVRQAVVLNLPWMALRYLEELPSALRGHPEIQAIATQIRQAQATAVTEAGDVLDSRFNLNLDALLARAGATSGSPPPDRAALLRAARRWRDRHRVDRDRSHRQVVTRLRHANDGADATGCINRSGAEAAAPGGLIEQIIWHPDAALQTLLQAPLPHEQDVSQQRVMCPPPYVFIGLRMAALLLRIERETREFLQGYQPALHVLVEHLETEMAPSSDVLDDEEFQATLAILHLLDLRPLLASDRVSVYLGSKATERLTQRLQDDETAMLPRYVLPSVRGHAGGGAAGQRADPAQRVSAAVRAVHEARLRGDLDRQRRAFEIYRPRDAAWWRRRYALALEPRSPEPLRIMIPVSRFTTYVRHAARQLEGALLRAGHAVKVLTEPNDHTVISASSYLRLLAEWQPDLVIEIDHLQQEKVNILPDNLPHISWIQDRLPNLFNREAATGIGPFQIIAGAGVRELVGHFGYPEQQTFPVLNGTDTSVYAPDPLPDAELAPHRCDIAWVSNHSTPPAEYARSLIEQSTATAAERRCAEWAARQVFRVFDEVAEREPTHRLHAARLFAAAGPRVGVAPHASPAEAGKGEGDPPPMPIDEAAQRTLFHFIVLPLADRIARHQALQWTIDYCNRRGRSLRLYGEGWERHPETQPYACGVIGNGRPLRAVYQAASINLHMSVYGAMHQRVFDGFASGGFVLCRRAACDIAGGLLQAAIRDMDALGRDRMRLSEAPHLRARVEADLYRGRRLADGGIEDEVWNFSAPQWAWWYEPRPRCMFRSFDDLAPSCASVTFATREELEARLDALLDRPEERAAVAEPIRRRIVEELGVDAIGRYFIDLMTDRLRRLTS